MSSAFSVVALIAAYNEADIIHHVVADLIAQGVGVYFLDDNSTDETVRIVEAFLGRGVLAVEQLPARDASDPFNWERILIRKSELAAELDATWFIHHDADEFREAPWAQLSLSDAIRQVDRLGFNAIDFAGLDFWPVDDGFKPGGDVRKALTGYTDFASYDRLQIRCWKKTGQLVDLASSGGHEAKFPDRKVFPLRFILRHYPIRGQAHGERKVFRERRSRFLEQERARGWHVQYDALREGESFLRSPSALTPYDADDVRLKVALRDVGAIGDTVSRAASQLHHLERELQRTQQELATKQGYLDVLEAHARATSNDLATVQAELLRAHAEINAKTAYIDAQTRALEEKNAEMKRWRHSVDSLVHRVGEIEQSLSWRLSSPARNLVRLFRGQ